MHELVSLSEKITLVEMNALKESEKIVDFGIRRFPAKVILGKEDFSIRFYGFTAGTEFSALLEDILMISLG